MADTSTYVPYDYRRLCDVCGELRNRSKLRKLIDIWVCEDHPNERRPQTLDDINAKQKPFRILPIPEAKPLQRIGPDVFYTEESEIFNLLDVANGARYVQVISGQPIPLANNADTIPATSWAAIYYYGLAAPTWKTGLNNAFLAIAKTRLRSAADTLLALQVTAGSRATSSYYGAFLGSGASVYYTEDTITAGLAALYAYRVLGDLKYLYAARAGASYLRNVQAIGSCGVNFTSTDSGGASRLYTGGLADQVSTVTGFFSNHLFFPSSLLALRFWTELTTTDGDQQIGATATIASEFSVIPQQLMSQSIADLRSFWLNGTFDVTQKAVITGLSATTPAEYFNAYPASKPNFTVTGDGSWDYQDAGASSGTLVSAINFAKALSALFFVEGYSTQVQQVDAWLQTFASNPTYQTAANTSPIALARATTGTYDPTQGVAQLLQVRASGTLAATALNGGSLYDWGAFGLLAPIWSKQRGGTLNLARDNAVKSRRRLSDGLISDGYWYDVGFYRGRQGLSFQTFFTETFTHGPSLAPGGSTGTGIIYDGVAAAQFASAIHATPRAPT